MKIIYRTNDGREFDTPEAAKAHEDGIEKKTELLKTKAAEINALVKELQKAGYATLLYISNNQLAVEAGKQKDWRGVYSL